MGKISLEVNGKKVEKEAPDNTLLSTFLREHLQLTGTHIGCDTSQCGACVVVSHPICVPVSCKCSLKNVDSKVLSGASFSTFLPLTSNEILPIISPYK